METLNWNHMQPTYMKFDKTTGDNKRAENLVPVDEKFVQSEDRKNSGLVLSLIRRKNAMIRTGKESM